MKNQGANVRAEAGYAMAAMLVAIAVMGILMSAAMPSWKAMVQRDREEELVFRGEQYARAVGLFQRKFAGGFPPSLDVLLEQKFLRKKYKDPMVEDGEFQIIYQNSLMGVQGQVPGGATARPGMVAQPTAPTLVPVETGTGAGGTGGRSGTTTGAPGVAGARGGIVGVTSKSTKSAYKQYKGRSKYNEWQFIYTQASQRVGAPGGAQPQPGMPGGGGGQPRPGVGTGSSPGSSFPRPSGSGTSPTRPGTSSFPPG